jgi:predicted CxxxxCH...CXXCH cytochrome family protein
MTFRSTRSRPLGAAVALALCVAGCDPSRLPLGPPARPPPGGGGGGGGGGTGACDGCHGAPPATGAHLAHSAGALTVAYGDVRALEDVASGGAAYGFGCGLCHPVDVTKHEDELVEVELAPPATPSGLRARNTPSAAWDPATRTCRGVYCHSSGQQNPVYVETPSWDAPAGSLGCAGCHGNPPRYASAGAGSAAPNSHLQLAADGWEWGHYAGMPGPTHPGGSQHGASGAASPITCQACHFDTTDPTATAPGGFFWLDTTGDYAMPGGDANRSGTTAWLHAQCGTCHDDVKAPTGRGRVLPLRHVNGRPDVVFDPRVELPADYPTGLPALATSDPVAPYYVSPFNVTQGAWTLPPGTTLRSTIGSRFPDVLAGTLSTATYDPVSGTCSNVACHVGRQWAVSSGLPPAPPLRWGDPYISSWTASCNGCHPMY